MFPDKIYSTFMLLAPYVLFFKNVYSGTSVIRADVNPNS
jgi:hypothetical protein